MKNKRLELRMTPSLIRRLDAYRRKDEDLPSRSEAARRLIDIALKIGEEKNAK